MLYFVADAFFSTVHSRFLSQISAWEETKPQTPVTSFPKAQDSAKGATPRRSFLSPSISKRAASLRIRNAWAAAASSDPRVRGCTCGDYLPICQCQMRFRPPLLQPLPPEALAGPTSTASASEVWKVPGHGGGGTTAAALPAHCVTRNPFHGLCAPLPSPATKAGPLGPAGAPGFATVRWL